jgi:hypothetical protein
MRASNDGGSSPTSDFTITILCHHVCCERRVTPHCSRIPLQLLIPCFPPSFPCRRTPRRWWLSASLSFSPNARFRRRSSDGLGQSSLWGFLWVGVGVSALMAVFHDLIVESDAPTTGGVSSDHSFPLFLRISDPFVWLCAVQTRTGSSLSS